MDAAHFHLAVNHVPVIGIIFAVLLLLIAVVRRTGESRVFGLLALVLVALVALPVYFTGEPAEEMVKDMPGVTEEIIDTHEDIAAVTTVAVEILGAVALVGLFLLARERLPGWFVPATLVLALVTAGLLGWTANTGGQIRHSEIRPGSAAPVGTGADRGVGEREEQRR